MNKRKLFLIILIIIISLNITGCWNYKEINEFIIVTAFAIDKNIENGKYIITVETINPKGGEETKLIPDVFSVEGESVFDAVRNAVIKSGEKLYFSHTKIVIISEEIAREGIVPVLDFLLRDAEVRADIWILISREKTAKNMLEGKDKIHDSLAFHIDETLRNQESIAKFYAVELIDFLDDLSERGISSTLPTTSIVIKKDEVVPEVYGTAMFKKDKMVGWINGEETRSMLIIKDEFKNGLIVIPKVAGTDTDITLEAIRSKTKLKPVINDENLSMKIDIKMEVNVGAILGYDDFISKDNRSKLKTQAQALIEKEILDVITKVQNQYKADIFGFGKAIYIQLPKVWKTIESDWENIFSDIQVDVNVELVIQGSGLLNTTIKTGD